MNRRSFFGTAGIGALSAAQPSASVRPNVLVFYTDQQRWDSVGAYGGPMDLTPNLDRMTKSAVRFEHAFTSQPVCAPARSTIQTGHLLFHFLASL